MLIDTHCHLDLEQFDADRTEVLARARAAGVGAIVIPSIDMTNVERVVALAEKSALSTDAEEIVLYAAVGVHPNSAATWRDDTLDSLHLLATQPHVVAIGEIGLDNYWKDATPRQQEDVLCQQLELAAEVGKPVIIHNREATEQVHAILREWVRSDAFRSSPLARRRFAGVLHAFGSGMAEAEEAWEWGFVLGLGGPVTFRNAHNLHRLVPQLQMDRLMLETDAPYLTPHPYRGKRNEPGHLALVCERIAELRGITAEAVAESTTAVARALFMLEDSILEDTIRADIPNDPREGDTERRLFPFGASGAGTC